MNGRSSKGPEGGHIIHSSPSVLYISSTSFVTQSKNPPEILKYRNAIFSHVPKRDHHPHDIFTHGTDQKNLMAFGGVKYDHHLGHSTETKWAARYTLAEEDGQLKFKKVHIVVVGPRTRCISMISRGLNSMTVGYCCSRLIAARITYIYCQQISTSIRVFISFFAVPSSILVTLPYSTKRRLFLRGWVFPNTKKCLWSNPIVRKAQVHSSHRLQTPSSYIPPICDFSSSEICKVA